MNMKALTRWGAGVLLVAAVVSCGSDGPDSSGQADTGTKTTQADAGGAGDAPATDPVDFTASEFKFDPSTLTLDAGTYTGTLTNDGSIQHDISFDGSEPVFVEPGESVEISFEVPAGGVTFMCTIEGHADAGMTGTIETA